MSKSKKAKVYQLKITLLGSKPKIWRRIQILDTDTFYDLHSAIQDAMGWTDSHLHEFTVNSPKSWGVIRIGMIHPELDSVGVIDESKVKINKHLSETNKKIQYNYDFGDDWGHEVLLEKILESKEGVSYPICTAGKNACPPEDCGGIWGYERLLGILKDPHHPEYQEIIEWIDEGFDPKEFSADAVAFLKGQYDPNYLV